MKKKTAQSFTKYYKKLSNRNMHIWLNLDELLSFKYGATWQKLAEKFVQKYPDLS
jgi:hypothetical protein